MLLASSLGSSVYIKLETEQVTNAFKVRGAIYSVHTAVENGASIIVTASTGNHAMAVAHAIKLLGVSGIIFLPENTTPPKLQKLQTISDNSSVELRIEGHDCLQAELAALRFSHQHQATYISPYNHYDIIAGQGTIAVEILNFFSRLPEVPSKNSNTSQCKSCYVTVGGGGLISGIASVLKIRQPGAWRVVGCLPQNSAVMYNCVRAGKVVTSVCKPTLSDGSAGDIEDGAKTVDLCHELVDAWAIVEEQEIANAMRDVFVQEGKVLEGAAAVAIAGFRRDHLWRESQEDSLAVIIACGANVDAQTFADIVSGRWGSAQL